MADVIGNSATGTEPLPTIALPLPPAESVTPESKAAAPESERLSKVREVGRRVVAKFRAGRGRPRADGSPKVSDTVETGDGALLSAADNPSLVAAAAVESAPGDLLFHKAIIQGTKGALNGLQDVTGLLAKEAGADAAFVDKLVSKLKPDPDTLAGFSESLDLVCKKRGISLKNAPEWSCGIYGAQLFLPYPYVWLMLLREIRAKRAAEAAARQPKQDAIQTDN